MILNETEKKNSLVFSLLLFIGIFSPTSINGQMSNNFSFISFFLLFIFFVILIKKRITPVRILLFILINVSLLLFTLSASFVFTKYSFGIYPNFFFLSLLSFLDLKNIKVNSLVRSSFLICTGLIIFLGFGVVFSSQAVLQFILNYYIAGYDNLLPNMLAGFKPVGTFATHSVAALFLFIFFYLNIKSYMVLKKFIYLLCAIILLILLFFIRSNSSLVFLLFSFFILFNLFKSNRTSLIIVLALISIIPLYFIFIDDTILVIMEKFDLSLILSSDKNGLRGRYSSESPLQPTIDYISNNPFSPLGLTVSDKLYYSDSGFILYILRGSLIMTLAIYYGLFNFLKTNIFEKKAYLFLLFILLLFEIGYPVLINIRMLFFLPFIVIYLNHIYNLQHES